MNLRKRLLDERAANVSEGEGIIAAAEAEGRDITAEETTRLSELKSRRTSIDTQLASIEDQREAVRSQEALPKQPVARVEVHDNREDKPFRGLGDQLLAIASSSIPGAEMDPRLMRAAATGAAAQTPSDGGFLIEMDYSEALLNKARTTSQLMGLCTEIPIGAGNDGIELPYIDETSRATGSRWGGVQVYRKAEAATVTATRPKIAEVEIRNLEMMGIAYATERLLRNAPAMERIFGDAFASEFAFKIDDEIVNGNGSGQMLGILNAGATVSQAKETNQDAATIVSRNLSNMWTHLPTRSKGNSAWFVNSEVTPQLDELSIPAGTAALEPRIVRYNEAGIMTIKGRPVIEIEQCAALGTVGDIILADLSQYIVATQGGLESAQSIHVRFLYNEMTFRWNYYVNGQPAWRTSVTPYKGSATISPFVTLATRS
jgi:HK97 family phage major capsid protein